MGLGLENGYTPDNTLFLMGCNLAAQLIYYRATHVEV
jgi:hypothetical protein